MEEIQIQGVQNLDKEPFASNQQTVAHEPDKFILDFKNLYAQYSPDNQPVPVVNHRVILLDTYAAKEFLRVLKENVEKYEEKFGKIKKPDSIIKAKKEIQKAKPSATGSPALSYMG